MKISDLEDIEKPLLNFDDKKAIKKRQTSFKPKPKPKPVKYMHSFKRITPMAIRKQVYDLFQENELTIVQISDKFGLPARTVSYIIQNYPRQAGIHKEPPRNDERIYSLELRVNRIERELNL